MQKLTPLEERMLAMISGDRAREHVARLIEPRERVAGSRAEHEGAETVRSLLEPLVDHCELHEVPAWTYERGEASLRVVSPVELKIDEVYVNPDSGTGSGSGYLIDAGLGTAGDYAALERSVEKAVVLIRIAGPEAVARGSASTTVPGSLNRLVSEAKCRGAACVLYHIDHRLHPSVVVSNVDVPTLAIGTDDADRLRSLLRTHEDVEIEFSSTVNESYSKMFNVVGTIAGSAFPDEVVYVTSHYDTWFAGANDNNSTSAVLLELASVLKKHRPARTFRIVIFAGEESGSRIAESELPFFIGSLAYTAELEAELGGSQGEVPVAVINGEILGFSPDILIRVTPELESLAHDVVRDLGVNRQVGRASDGGWVVSDHVSFHSLGIPAVYLHPLWPGGDEDYWPLYHTPMDDLNVVNASALQENARAFCLLALRLGADEELPVDLSTLVATAQRGLGASSSSARIGELLRRSLQSLEREEHSPARRRRQLALARAIHRNIFCFAGLTREFSLKFPFLDETMTRLRETHYLLEIDQDRERALSAFSNISDVRVISSFSDVVLEAAIQREVNTPLLKRLETHWIDARKALDAFRHAEDVHDIAARIRSLVSDVQRAMDQSAERFESDLRISIDELPRIDS